VIVLLNKTKQTNKKIVAEFYHGKPKSNCAQNFCVSLQYLGLGLCVLSDALSSIGSANPPGSNNLDGLCKGLTENQRHWAAIRRTMEEIIFSKPNRPLHR
jgi:hypothetical protein